MTKIDEIISRFRKELHSVGCTFFLAYSFTDPATGEPGVKLSSNSSKTGIQAILSAYLRPTEQALTLIAEEIAGSAAAGHDLSLEILKQMKADGKFLQAAKVLFE